MGGGDVGGSMAVKKVCDVCGEEAVTVMEFKTDNSTPLIKDLCEKHFAEVKKFFAEFLKNAE